LQDTEANKFLADIKKSIPDEEMATKEYADMANVADRLGHPGIADTLRSMSGDEARHGRLLKDMLGKLPVRVFIKEFELVPGDRVRLTMPASEPFPAGCAEGVVLTAKHYGERDGWYIELNKDKVSPGWQSGYGYWKQGTDGGSVEKLG